MNNPTIKATAYTQGSKDKLPLLDPVKQEVASPFKAPNAENKEVAGYLAPATGKPPAEDAATIRRRSGQQQFDDVNIAINGVPDSKAVQAKKIADAEAAAAAQPSAFDKVWEASKVTSKDMAKKIAGDNPKAIFRSIKDVTTVSGEGVGLDFDKVKSRVERAFGAGGSTNGLSGTMKDSIVNAAEIVGGKDVGIIVGDALLFVDGRQYEDVSSVMDLVERVTQPGGALDVLDFAGQAALINGIANKLIDWGVPDIIDDILDTIKDIRFKNSMYEELCIRAAAQGSLEITNHYGELMGSSRRHAIADDVIKNIMMRFILPKKDTRSLSWWGAELLRVINTFKTNWDIDPYDHNITCLYYYSVAGDDTTNVLRHTDKRIHAIAGLSVNYEPPERTILRSFPQLVI